MTDAERNYACAAIFDTKNYDPDSLRAAASIVVDLAASDPVVHHEVDYGQSDAYTCGACGVDLVGDAAYTYQKSDGAKFPHAMTCPWRRAAILVERMLP